MHRQCSLREINAWFWMDPHLFSLLCAFLQSRERAHLLAVRTPLHLRNQVPRSLKTQDGRAAVNGEN